MSDPRFAVLTPSMRFDPKRVMFMRLPLPARIAERLDNVGAGFMAVAVNVSGLPVRPAAIAVTR